MDIDELEETVLKGLYENRIEGGFKSLNSFFTSENMITRHQAKLIFEELSNQGYIKGRSSSNGYIAEITIPGIKYTEGHLLNSEKTTSKREYGNIPKPSMEDKYNILLKYLYFSNSIYNDIKKIFKRHIDISSKEVYSIGQILEQRGYITFAGSDYQAAVDITAFGREYVEKNLLNYNNYDPKDIISKNDKENFAVMLDDLLERLRKIELGQQIIHDDFEKDFNELKSLLNVLGKKDWKQLLVGKLVDAGLGSLTENVVETVAYSFKDQLKLS